MTNIVVCALYKFVRLANYQQLQQPLLLLMKKQQVRGTLLLAHEGINGTIAGTRAGIDRVIDWLEREPALAALELKLSITEDMPFKRSRVKIKKEIVTMGVPGIDPARSAGAYVEPEQWNALISDPDVVLIDTRNDYECQVGQFEGSVNPKTETFREFPEYAKEHLEQHRGRKIAMFCTGGIRCEKSTAYLKEQGFEEVYHLKGGILNYLEKIPADQSMWRGECFVFDDRVTVDHELQPGSYDQCHACRRPISELDKEDSHYRPGVSCPHCYEEKSPEQQARFSEREKQIQLARSRGEEHLGDDARKQLAANRARKRKRPRD